MQDSGLWIMFLLHPNALLLSESLRSLVPSDERLDNLTTMSFVSSHLRSTGSPAGSIWVRNYSTDLT